MKCIKCGERIKNRDTYLFFGMIIPLFLIFCGLVLIAPTEVFFVSGILILTTIVQVEKKFKFNMQNRKCNMCLKEN